MPTPTPSPVPPIEGDIVDANGGAGGDGQVLANDVTIISQMVLGNIPGPVNPSQFQRADVNEPCGNGMIDAGDVTVISQYSLGNIPPRGACGMTAPGFAKLVQASMDGFLQLGGRFWLAPDFGLR